jgi:hypothetical protein
MTLVDFSIELELSGFELVLVLARYKQEEPYFHSSQSQDQLYPHSLVEPNRTNAVKGNTNTSNHADNISRLHWIEISPDIHTNDASIFAPDPMLHSKVDGVSDENLQKESDKKDVQKEPRHHDSMNDTNGLFDRMSSSLGEVEQKYVILEEENTKTTSRIIESLNRYGGPKNISTTAKETSASAELQGAKNISPHHLFTENASTTDDDDDHDQWDDDENPWLGCICGRTHVKQTDSTSTALFWIQCDDCQAWYECRKECIGFNETEALELISWTCPACVTPVCGDEDSKSAEMSDMHGDRHQTSLPKTLQKVSGGHKRSNEADLQVLPIGTIVNISNRTWAGSNKPGGVAKVIQSHRAETSDDVFYDVKYILGGRESKVESKYVNIHDELMNDLSN